MGVDGRVEMGESGLLVTEGEEHWIKAYKEHDTIRG